MTFEEIKEVLKEFEGTEEFNSYVSGFITGDRVQNYLETEDGKKLVQPMLDKHFSKGIETWKTNNLSKLIDDEIKTRFPEADPKDIELADLKAQFEALQQESRRKELTIKAQTMATDKKLPVDLVHYFIGSDEKETENNLTAFEKAFSGAVGAAVDEKLKDHSHIPTDDKQEPLDGVTRRFMELNPDIELGV